jgi:folate-dependent phosphoribosylglycinamide formyltransferase PurN
MKWIPIFSQTGSEIVNLSKVIGIKPKLIITNNVTEEKYQYHPGLRELGVTILMARHDRLMDYLMSHVSSDTLITLHGYLRIIPPHVCNKFEMLNGHPGLITVYPELKGKDPQQRITPQMTHIGSVVHKVTEGVDEGEILSVSSVENTNTDPYNILKQTSLNAWRSYFEQRSST